MIYQLPTVMGLAASGGGLSFPFHSAPLFLAQLGTPEAGPMFEWMKIAVALLACAALIKQLWPIGRKPPIDVDLEMMRRVMSETYMTKDDLIRLREDLNERFSGMNQKVNGLHERFSNMFGELRELRGSFLTYTDQNRKGKA